MFESIIKFFKNIGKKEEKKEASNSKEAAKERLHLVLMQDRANVSADFLELMKQEIIEVIKKYIEVDEEAIDVRLTNEKKDDGTNGAPALYANIPILNIKNEARKVEKEENNSNENKDEKEKNKNQQDKSQTQNQDEKNREQKHHEEKKQIQSHKENNIKSKDEKMDRKPNKESQEGENKDQKNKEVNREERHRENEASRIEKTEKIKEEKEIKQ